MREQNCECIVCGNSFVAKHKGAKYCSQQCKRVSDNERLKQRQAAIRESMKKEPNWNRRLARINQEARDAGMTYGKYVALNQI